MLFKDYHIDLIRSGQKTVTRREWDDNYHGPSVGTVVAATTHLFTSDEEADCYIRVTGKREEPLGEISEESARREGDYDGVEDFRDGYEDVYGDGAWDPEKEVTVVEFKYVGRSRDAGEQTNLATDGGIEDGTGRYADWRSQIRSKLEAFEGHGPPSVNDLWNVAGFETQGVTDWIDESPPSQEDIKTLKGDLLKALVALEMAEERLNADSQEDTGGDQRADD